METLIHIILSLIRLKRSMEKKVRKKPMRKKSTKMILTDKMVTTTRRTMRLFDSILRLLYTFTFTSLSR
jgi:hypothetical protein